MRYQRFTYGRHRRLRSNQNIIFKKVMADVEINDSALQEKILEPSTLFEKPVSAIWLEIGFGAGEHLFAQANANPDIGFIGCEPFKYGVARLCKKLDVGGLKNVRIYMGDARVILSVLKQHSIQRLFILFPDPWPKKRHHKRRIINSETIPIMRRVIVPGGELRIASDETSYIQWILGCMSRADGISWNVSKARDWQQRNKDWPQTRYEKKALLAGRRPIYLNYKIGSSLPSK